MGSVFVCVVWLLVGGGQNYVVVFFVEEGKIVFFWGGLDVGLVLFLGDLLEQFVVFVFIRQVVQFFFFRRLAEWKQVLNLGGVGIERILFTGGILGDFCREIYGIFIRRVVLFSSFFRERSECVFGGVIFFSDAFVFFKQVCGWYCFLLGYFVFREERCDYQLGY